jgi:hypothetical protein
MAALATPAESEEEVLNQWVPSSHDDAWVSFETMLGSASPANLERK